MQTADARTAATVRTRLTDADTKALAALDVYCHQGVVVIAGVVPPASPLRAKAVEIARGVEGVRRVLGFDPLPALAERTRTQVAAAREETVEDPVDRGALVAALHELKPRDAVAVEDDDFAVEHERRRRPSLYATMRTPSYFSSYTQPAR